MMAGNQAEAVGAGIKMYSEGRCIGQLDTQTGHCADNCSQTLHHVTSLVSTCLTVLQVVTHTSHVCHSGSVDIVYTQYRGVCCVLKVSVVSSHSTVKCCDSKSGPDMLKQQKLLETSLHGRH